MRKWLPLLLASLLTLSLFVSCAGGTPSEPVTGGEGTSGTESSSYSETVEPITEPPAEDPFEGADPLPADLQIPDKLKNANGTVLGTIVLPAGAAEDGVLKTAAEELRYHIEKVTGANLPIVSRTGEGYASIILTTPDALPSAAGIFADDFAWLSDLGSKETGRYGEDGFAVRQAGEDVYILGAVSKGVLNGVYDFIEENLGVLWVRADESEGLIYKPLDEAVAAKVDYREKSPFLLRGWMMCGITGEPTNPILMARNKLNTTNIPYAEYGIGTAQFGHTIKWYLTASPIYDPEEPDYWETDEEGNSLGYDGSNQVNVFSDKTADCIAAYIIAKMQSTGERMLFVGEEDVAPHKRMVPYDTQPFEYAPGEFVYPEDVNYYSTVFSTMINKIARKVKEAVPDGMVGMFAYNNCTDPPACKMEENVYCCVAPWCEDMSFPILDTAIKGVRADQSIAGHCDDIRGWAEKCDHMYFWNYYICYKGCSQYGWPIWNRIQADLQGYVELGVVDGLVPEGEIDLETPCGLISYWDGEGNHSNVWDMNMMLNWIYAKLAWNPFEDVPTLIQEFCDKVYGDASPYMQEYYRLLEQGWYGGLEGYTKPLNIHTAPSEYYKTFVLKQEVAHPMLDALEAAYNACAEGPVKEMIHYVWDRTLTNLKAFRSFQ